MRVVLVPSSYEKDDEVVEGEGIKVLKSLMDFDPASYQLPPFADMLHGIVHMNPIIFLKGTVVRGFGRGAKVHLSVSLYTEG